MTTHEQEEFNRTMDILDQYIASASNGRATRDQTIAKSVSQDEEPQKFPSTRIGLASFAKSAPMRELISSNPAAFRQQYLNFILDHELVRRGEVTPEEVSSWSHTLSALPLQGALNKAVTDVEPRPWDFPPSPRGLQQFLASDEMRDLAKSYPARWRELHLNFFAALEPRPLPQEIGMKRHELQTTHPDHGTPSAMAKALATGSMLTNGQSVLVANFGRELGDPSVWLRS